MSFRIKSCNFFQNLGEKSPIGLPISNYHPHQSFSQHLFLQYTNPKQHAPNMYIFNVSSVECWFALNILMITIKVIEIIVKIVISEPLMIWHGVLFYIPKLVNHQLLLWQHVDRIGLHCANKIMTLFELIIILWIFSFRAETLTFVKNNLFYKMWYANSSKTNHIRMYLTAKLI